MSKALNAVKDGYLAAVNWVDDNPHKTLWLAVGAIVLALLA